MVVSWSVMYFDSLVGPVNFVWDVEFAACPGMVHLVVRGDGWSLFTFVVVLTYTSSVLRKRESLVAEGVRWLAIAGVDSLSIVWFVVCSTSFALGLLMPLHFVWWIEFIGVPGMVSLCPWVQDRGWLPFVVVILGVLSLLGKTESLVAEGIGWLAITRVDSLTVIRFVVLSSSFWFGLLVPLDFIGWIKLVSVPRVVSLSPWVKDWCRFPLMVIIFNVLSLLWKWKTLITESVRWLSIAGVDCLTVIRFIIFSTCFALGLFMPFHFVWWIELVSIPRMISLSPWVQNGGWFPFVIVVLNVLLKVDRNRFTQKQSNNNLFVHFIYNNFVNFILL